MTRIPRTMWWADYAEFLASAEWQAIRAGAMLRAKGKCERCGRPAQQVHHKTYARAMGGELPSDLEAVCFACHQKHHKASPAKKRSKEKQRKRKKVRSAKIAERHARNGLRKSGPKKKPKGMSVWTMSANGKLHPTAG